MFGRTPRLPVDIAFGLPLREPQHKNHSQALKSRLFFQALKSRLQESFNIAARNSTKSADRNKARFDNRVIPSALVPGDRVLVRNVRLRGKQKLSDKWEQEVYGVVHRAGDLPVYKVKPEIGFGPTRTLHRDLLLPCAFLRDSNENLQPEKRSPVHRPRTRQRSKDQDPSTDTPAEEDEDSENSALYPLNSPTVHFTVERQRHIPVMDPPTVTERQIMPVSDHPDEADDQREPTSSVPSTSASVAELSSEQQSDVEENQPENQTNDLPVNLPEELPTEDPPEESDSVEPLDNDSDVPDMTLRRSQRQRVQPQRLQYPTLGNPLISVVQTMLHSLSDALGISANTDNRLPSVHIV